MYETFEHTADLGLRVTASSREDLFVEAGRGLTAMLVEQPERVKPEQERSIRIEGDENEYLLFDWLNELLFLHESTGLLWSDLDVSFDGSGLQATVRGESTDPERHQPAHEVKAITYHGLTVEEVDGNWTAEVIVDI